jgi:hypothetical protein
MGEFFGDVSSGMAPQGWGYLLGELGREAIFSGVKSLFGGSTQAPTASAQFPNIATAGSKRGNPAYEDELLAKVLMHILKQAKMGQAPQRRITSLNDLSQGMAPPDMGLMNLDDMMRTLQ